MNVTVSRTSVVLLGVAVLLAGCAGPGSDGGGDGQEFTDPERTETPDGEETPTPDQDAGAEPVVPPDDQNRTNATTPDQASPSAGAQSG